jgi:hypothetical protein
MTIGGTTCEVPIAPGEPLVPLGAVARPVLAPLRLTDPVAVDLVLLAWARSGDKGQLFNVAVIARQPDWLPLLKAALTPEAVSEWYRHLGQNGQQPTVRAFDVPGVHALNFVIEGALSGGINASTRLDPAAKGMAQMLLRFPVPVPAALAATFNSQTSKSGE